MVPGRPARRLDAAARQPSPEIRVAEHAAHAGDDRFGVVGDDERFAVLEEARDAAAVGDDHGRSGCGRFGGHDAEALPLGGQHEDVCLRVEIVRRLFCHWQGMDAAGCSLGCTHEI